LFLILYAQRSTGSVGFTHVNRRTANILPADGKTCGVHFVFAMVMMMMVLMTRI
jgi:hypothetical protein